MSEKKNGNLIGIIIGAVVCVAIVAVSALAIGKMDTPIAIVNGKQTTETTTQAPEDDLVFEEDDFNEDELFVEEEIIIEEEELLLEEEDTYDVGNLDFDVPETTTKKPTTTKPSTTKPTTKPNQGGNDEPTSEKQPGMFGYEFDQLDPNKPHFFTSNDAWQRNFGFCKMYDDLAPLIAFYYDTERIFFEYGDYDWMVQLWKGQYGFIFIGSEIGIYHKDKDRTEEFYDCVDDTNRLDMKMTLYSYGADGKEQVLFDRPEGKYWWITGFVPGKLTKFADRSELKVVAKITFFDEEMTNAFLEGFKSTGFVEESEWTEPELQPNKKYTRKKFYSVSGNTVSLTWQ